MLVRMQNPSAAPDAELDVPGLGLLRNNADTEVDETVFMNWLMPYCTTAEDGSQTAPNLPLGMSLVDDGDSDKEASA